GGEGGARENRAVVRLVQVRAHAGHVADVVANVIGDRGGVAGVVFGNAGLDLADQVRADVGGLGVNPAADAGEQGLRAGAHAVAEHDDRQRLEAEVGERVEDEEPGGDVEQGETDDDEAHHRPGTEGDA